MPKIRKDIIAVIFLLIGIFLLFLPALSGKLGIFHDDQAMAEFPWHYFLARHFQKGEIPLWEPDTWCGAIPFYARYYMDTYYFPLWPFYLLARLGDLNQAYWLLSLIPLLLHYWLAGIGMYIFARRAIHLRRLPAFIAAWAYVFSPAFAYSYVWISIVMVQAWLPWLLTLVASLDRRPSVGKVIGAAVIVALMSFAATPPHVGYGLLLLMILSVSLALRRFRRGRRLRDFRGPLLTIIAIILGVLLSAVYWFSLVDGLSFSRQHIAPTYPNMTGGDGSLPPLALSTLFVPQLFGTVTGQHNWGAAISGEVRFWEANTSYGLLLIFLSVTGLLLIARRKGMRRFRFWAVLSGAIWVFAIICMLGRHTPFYYLFFKLVPGLGEFPYPIRYRMLSCLATACLAGIGLENLSRSRLSRRPWPAGLVWGYLGLAASFILLVLIFPQDLTSRVIGQLKSFQFAWAFPGLKEVWTRGEGGWFLSYPAAYFLAATALLILCFRGLRGRVRVITAAGLVMAETAVFTAAAFYGGTFEHRYPRPEHVRFTRPEEYPFYLRILGRVASLRGDSSLRWATDSPFYDNCARLEGSFALMGYDMKPLEIRFKQAWEAAYNRPVDWPIYWGWGRTRATREFYNNLSVGYLLDRQPETPFARPEGNNAAFSKDTATITLDRYPFGTGVDSAPYYLHFNPEALPRVFTLDRVVECSPEEQMEELVRGDLRRAVFMDRAPAGLPADRVSLKSPPLHFLPPGPVREQDMGERSIKELDKYDYSPVIGSDLALSVRELIDPLRLRWDLIRLNTKSTEIMSLPPERFREYFKELQRENQIKELDLSLANQIRLEADIKIPSFLVLTEDWYPGWQARVDGNPAPVYRVNYLQRGVWLEEGQHQVELFFRPSAWRRGAIISLAFWLLVAGAAIFLTVKKTRQVISDY